MNNDYTKKARAVLKNAAKHAREMGQAYVGSEHLLLGLVEDEGSVAGQLLGQYGLTMENTSELLISLTDNGVVAAMGSGAQYTPRMNEILDDAEYICKAAGDTQVGTEHLLLALLRNTECLGNRAFASLGVDIRKLYASTLEIIGNPQLTQALNKGAAKQNKKSMLDKYTRDLTAAARAGRLDVVVGRDAEIARVMQILSRRTKNNPCLIGEPGVGKTAIVEAIAQRIVRNQVPDTLENKRLLTADITAMVAGSKYRGEFEERIKGLIDEVRGNGNVLLFVDEVHTLIGAGDSEGGMDAANILKPALARGELQIIGATTVSEYRKHIEKDAALERRFQPVMVEEPSMEDCVKILQGLRPAYEKHHGVTITDDALDAAVKLSARYISDRFLPDKAIDVIDEASSKVRMVTGSSKALELEIRINELEKLKEEAILAGDIPEAQSKSEEIRSLKEKQSKKTTRRKKSSLIVNAETVAETVSDWTRIPVKTLATEEMERLRKLESILHERVIGQNEAIEAVSKAVRRGRAGFNSARRPIGSFLFLGPTGVGKTEISKALAEAVYGSEKSIIRVDMSEYMEKASVSKMIGSPPGYVGYNEGGQLTDRVRKNPYSVVLFDEIEKAHPDVFNILLQVLDEGQVTDSQGRKIDFKNTIIIMTSNCGASSIASEKHLGFGAVSEAAVKHEQMKKKVMEEVKKTFKPEFLNRIDETIVFTSLSKEELKQIAALMLKNLSAQTMESRKVTLKFDQEVIEFLTEKGYDVKYGARPIRRAIQTYVIDMLSDAVLDGRIHDGTCIEVYRDSDGLAIKTV
ncbi:MAG: ATP-dependent Clp protease ATP-binding subunit [Lachnospiraceae bacterium]|nr:ATP-dependent Clp protease ATP-binding subunit [Lachnospiraceae bacterium]